MFHNVVEGFFKGHKIEKMSHNCIFSSEPTILTKMPCNYPKPKANARKSIGTVKLCEKVYYCGYLFPQCKDGVLIREFF